MYILLKHITVFVYIVLSSFTYTYILIFNIQCSIFNIQYSIFNIGVIA